MRLPHPGGALIIFDWQLPWLLAKIPPCPSIGDLISLELPRLKRAEAGFSLACN
jgi:hypothetical protein